MAKSLRVKANSPIISIMTDSLLDVKGVGPAVAEKLHKLGISRIEELIAYIPRRYDDYSHLTSISKIRPGPVSIKATIKQVKGHYVRRGMHITEAVASDDTGSVRLVWFNQPYRENALKPNTEYYISGDFGINYRRLSITNPSIELASDFPVNTARIVPIYPETKGVRSVLIRKVMREVIPVIRQKKEVLPGWLVQVADLMPYAEAVEALHFPKNSTQLKTARHRLAFQEVFELILASLIVKRELGAEPAVPIPFQEKLAKQFVSHLPFHLTNAQKKVTWRIYQEMQKPKPMNQLVEGDVGSGKTVVAAMAALMVADSNHQTAVMAPTELLARQHAETFYKLLEPLGMEHEICLLVGGMKKSEKDRAKASIASGRAHIILGTHALIQESVDMYRLALVVIDEQHRFGVQQRKTLMAKAGVMPHVLSLTATPIPRSLALTLYGEMDISLIESKPAGRLPVKTETISPNSRAQLFQAIKDELLTGRQMFVVCPLITDTDKKEKKSVENVFNDMLKAFPEFRIASMHGKMKADDKNETMKKFVNHEIDILVSTTVIEVGVDVPNASIMLIEAAEQFGLAQVHQLRGRVGRGEHQGYCYLMMSDSKAPTKRLRALETTNDGFKLAELDLELRGPGAIYGSVQHGALDLRIATLTDLHLISEARKAADQFLEKDEDLIHYPQLAERIIALQKVTKLN
jgi:ATP-dependent DNA helicase RecG